MMIDPADGTTGVVREWMTIDPVHNTTCEITRQTSYVPTHVDVSVPLILAHRGVPRRRIAALLTDLDRSGNRAGMEIETLLPAAKWSGKIHKPEGHGEHEFEITLDGRTVWGNGRLTIRATLPDTVLAALPGRTVGDLIDHPALADRMILSAERRGTGIVVEVERRMRNVHELAEADASIVRATDERIRARDAWVAREGGCYEDDWHIWADGLREKAMADFLEGGQVFASTCWGEPEPTLERLTAIGTAARDSTQGLFERMGRWLRRVTGRATTDAGMTMKDGDGKP